MATWIVLAAFVAVVLGYSPAPILATGALAITILAYIVAKRHSVLRLGASFAVFVAGHYFAVSAFGVLIQSGSTFELRMLRFMVSDELLAGVSSLVMLISVMIGVHGPDLKGRLTKDCQ
jgi:hypothetical protein